MPLVALLPTRLCRRGSSKSAIGRSRRREKALAVRGRLIAVAGAPPTHLDTPSTNARSVRSTALRAYGQTVERRHAEKKLRPKIIVCSVCVCSVLARSFSRHDD